MWVRGLKRLSEGGRGRGTRVAPYVGAWIETSLNSLRLVSNMSHPMWVRGLKHSF